MTHILSLAQDNPVIYLKAYGGVQVKGVDKSEVQCDISAPQLATLVEEDGHVYVTVNASCSLTVPESSSVEIERGMGSVKITNIKNKINIEKVLGNLVLFDIGAATIEKVGGNFSVNKASGPVQVEKVAATLTVEDVASFSCEKVGGSCTASKVQGDFHLEKAGGDFKAQAIEGLTQVAKVGGSFVGKDLKLEGDLKAGGKIRLINVKFEDDLSLRAGGDVDLGLSEGMKDIAIKIHSGTRNIKIKTNEDDLEIEDASYDYQVGEEITSLSIAAGGSVSLTDNLMSEEDIIGDLSGHFTFEESAFSEMIQERINSATRKTEAKIKTAEIRLEQIRDQVEERRGVNGEVEMGDGPDREHTKTQGQAVPPIPRPVGKKGASDEERLMILTMLQDNKITVDEAETLFRALED